MLKLQVRSVCGAMEQKSMSRAMVVGRGADCDVVLDDQEVSRRHCRVEPYGQGCLVIDLGSRNGCLVNGRRLDRHEIAPGQAVQLGGTLLTLERAEPEPQVVIPMVEEALPITFPVSPPPVKRLPLDSFSPEVAEMLRELAPNPEDYDTGDAADQAPPAAAGPAPAADAAPQSNPSINTRGVSAFSVRQSMWDQAAMADLGNARKEPRPARFAAGSTAVLLGWAKQWQLGGLQFKQGIAAAASVGLAVVLCYQAYTLFAEPNVPPPPSHQTVRSHRMSDD